MPGGMGGGIMGMLMSGTGGMMGGGPQNAPESSNAMQSDVYDVDRWKRADDVDAAPTTVQAVRSAWEREQAEREQRSLKYKLKTLLKKLSGKKESKGEDRQEAQPAGGTVVMPEMKKASKRISSPGEQVEKERAVPIPEIYGNVKSEVNYLGLDVPTGIDDFFTENPLNSAILAVDSLSMGPLTLNQVKAGSGKVSPDQRAEAVAAEPLREAGPADQKGKPANTSYMDDFHANREQRKYQVRIT